ncbi:hypothetical protein ZIOFF_057330 [Zingiber officinale]|uniref:Uncharacterized protein n=1 Tax=Zingiber officinale TaxID=94328 RepID=A0A8J5F442_ZINOF|nr:hypothetical protein ZIOFF_057330 [Zingiber officinale]
MASSSSSGGNDNFTTIDLIRRHLFTDLPPTPPSSTWPPPLPAAPTSYHNVALRSFPELSVPMISFTSCRPNPDIIVDLPASLRLD